MRKDGRKSDEQNAFLALLCSHHTIETTLSLMDLNMDEVPGGDISARLEDGQVTVDADSDVTRAVDLDLMDPEGALHLDSNSPDAGALFADRMIRIKYHVINPAGTVRYTTPVFTGPITALDRDGSRLKVELQGKEIFGLSEAWNERTWKKGARVTTVIRYIVKEMMGETHFNIPNLSKKLSRNVSVGGDKLPWIVAKQLAASIGYHLYFDAMGICQMRKMPSASVFTFQEGQSVKTEPQVGFDIEEIVNAVEVFGKQPNKKQRKSGRRRPHAKVVASRSHPLSPWKLGRKSGPRYLPVTIEDNGITSNAEARQRARRELGNLLLESVEVGYDALTIPGLEELDVVTIKTSRFTAKHRARQFTIGLLSGAESSMGYVKNVKPNTSKIRPKRKKTKKRRGR
jgi:hypothetical protein